MQQCAYHALLYEVQRWRIDGPKPVLFLCFDELPQLPIGSMMGFVPSTLRPLHAEAGKLDIHWHCWLPQWHRFLVWDFASCHTSAVQDG